MKRESYKLMLPEGLHARSASKFVKIANSFSSDLTVITNGREVNGKSIIGIMSLGAYCGATLELIANGTDEAKMIEALKELIESKGN